MLVFKYQQYLINIKHNQIRLLKIQYCILCEQCYCCTAGENGAEGKEIGVFSYWWIIIIIQNYKINNNKVEPKYRIVYYINN